jgi:hypothetical protein
MQLRADQFSRLVESRRQDFLARLAAFIEDKSRRAPEPPVLAALFDRAQQYGLVTEQHIAGYVMLAWASGARPPEADPSWIAQVMADLHRAPADRLDALFAAADRRRETRE